jgi:hypothetical protein
MTKKEKTWAEKTKTRMTDIRRGRSWNGRTGSTASATKRRSPNATGCNSGAGAGRSSAGARIPACDAEECFQQKWQSLPEEMRMWIRAGIKAPAEGLSPSRASDAADAEVERHRALMAKYNRTFSGEPLEPAAQAAKETAEASKTALPHGRGL